MAPPVSTLIYDLPAFSISCDMEAEGLQPTSFIYDGEVPKELMDAYKQLVADGLGRVSVSTDMGVKKFGSGASAMVSITLTCNQDQQTIQSALELAAQMGRWYASKYRGEAEQELRNSLAAVGRQLEV